MIFSSATIVSDSSLAAVRNRKIGMGQSKSRNVSVRFVFTFSRSRWVRWLEKAMVKQLNRIFVGRGSDSFWCRGEQKQMRVTHTLEGDVLGCWNDVMQASEKKYCCCIILSITKLKRSGFLNWKDWRGVYDNECEAHANSPILLQAIYKKARPSIQCATERWAITFESVYL